LSDDTLKIITVIGIIIVGMPLAYIGYKIGVGKFLNLQGFWKKFFFWYARIISIFGATAGLRDFNYFLDILVFIFVGFFWANFLDKIFKKIMSLKDGVQEPFKDKNYKEKNDIEIKDLRDKLKEKKSKILQEEQINILKKQIEDLENPPSEIKEVEKIEPEPIEEKVINPIVEENKKEMKNVLRKLGF
jgi:hypothetical protein